MIQYWLDCINAQVLPLNLRIGGVQPNQYQTALNHSSLHGFQYDSLFETDRCLLNDLDVIFCPLSCVQGTSHNSLKRWSHSSCVVGDQLLVFGGFGSDGAHQRINDLQVYDPKLNRWHSPTLCGSVPSPRMGHACVSLGKIYLPGICFTLLSVVSSGCESNL